MTGKDTQTPKNAFASTTQHLEVITKKDYLYLNDYVLECGSNTFVCKKHKKHKKKKTSTNLPTATGVLYQDFTL